MPHLVRSDYKNNFSLFHQGNDLFSYRLLGAHIEKEKNVNGVRFSVWAPNAKKVQLVGDFNDWNGSNHSMIKTFDCGIWQLFVPGLKEGDIYKYKITDANENIFLKADPYAFYSETRPSTASIVYSLENYSWNDSEWIQKKQQVKPHERPLNIYEVHLGSWKKKDGNFFSYRELADELIDYVVDLGYTHIEILPIMEHPYDKSWGYQTTGLFSATSRYGTPKEFMHFIDKCHQKNVGVILDWIPAHFTKDAHGLRQFDGTPLFEYEGYDRAESEWGSLCFDLGKNEVNSFLLSNALFWMDLYHIDGLRVDAVSSILYRDFGKREGEWTPNQFGGRENIEAISFLKKLNESVFDYFPATLMIAEESTAWPLVTGPTYLGGLGFNFKWNMGWMNDVLTYMQMDPLYRKYHHNLLTFSFFYAFSENFILALSHDEVVHGKKSLLNKMPGDYWQKFANLRVLFGYMITHPGKKTLFMGGEIAQFDEWKDETELDWNLLSFPMHQQFKTYIEKINHLYKAEASLWEIDHNENGFSWIDPDNVDQSIIVFMRKGIDETLIILCNFTPMTYTNYRIGVPLQTVYTEILNSDNEQFGGSGVVNDTTLVSEEIPWHNQDFSLDINVPPLGIVVLKEKNKNK